MESRPLFLPVLFFHSAQPRRERRNAEEVRRARLVRSSARLGVLRGEQIATTGSDFQEYQGTQLDFQWSRVLLFQTDQTSPQTSRPTYGATQSSSSETDGGPSAVSPVLKGGSAIRVTNRNHHCVLTSLPVSIRFAQSGTARSTLSTPLNGIPYDSIY